MDKRKAEYIANAEMAIVNNKFEVALDYFNKAITEDATCIMSHSGAGKVYLLLGRYSESEQFFQRAVELDSANGERYFDLANAKFGLQKYAEALRNYALADQFGCSNDIRQKLYYQIGILSQVSGDVQSALLNYDKSDSIASLNMDQKDIILNRLKIYADTGDLQNAENYAAQLRMIAPGEFRSYQLYFQILLQQQKVDKAQEVLCEAETYFVADKDVQIEITFDKALLECFRAELDSMYEKEHYSAAVSILRRLEQSGDLPNDVEYEILLTLAEIHLKLDKRDVAVTYAERVVNEKVETSVSQVADASTPNVEVSESELEELADKAMQVIEDNDLLEYAEFFEDEDGNEVISIPDEILDAHFPSNSKQEENDTTFLIRDEPKSAEGNFAEYFDKARFILSECFLANKHFKRDLEHIRHLKLSENAFYRYYSIYSEALALRMTAGNDSALKKHAIDLYDKAIAYFKNRIIEDPSDITAIVFRVRSYSDIGKYEKATELTHVLSPEASAPLLAYIKECQTSGK